MCTLPEKILVTPLFSPLRAITNHFVVGVDTKGRAEEHPPPTSQDGGPEEPDHQRGRLQPLLRQDSQYSAIALQTQVSFTQFNYL